MPALLSGGFVTIVMAPNETVEKPAGLQYRPFLAILPPPPRLPLPH